MGHKLITTTINPNRICKSMIIPALVCQTNVSFERFGFFILFSGGVGASQGQAANVAPFPGCAAAMKCVTEEFCSVDGVMINTPVRLSDYEKEYLRVPLMVRFVCF
jgi:hypothetical protein